MNRYTVFATVLLAVSGLLAMCAIVGAVTLTQAILEALS